MAIIVVGGGGRGAGKTALVCGLIRALPDAGWTAIKITTHAHGHAEPIFEERVAGQGTDTARYLAAGAKRALLVTASEGGLAAALHRILDEHRAQRNLVFESNSVLHHVQPDLCFAVASNLSGARKPSFEIVERCADATVALGGHDHVIQDQSGSGERIHFHLASLERISPPMLAWLHEKLAKR
jgi:Molybdopterin guanine dinucleotide synthesis protein B